jgi:hypothetical protein
MCGISKYFNYKHHANWNIYDVKVLKTFFDNKNFNIFAVSDSMCDVDVNIHRNVEPFLQHFQRVATYAHILDAQLLLLTEAEARTITDIGAYSDINDAYATAHVNFMKAISVCLNTLSTIDKEISLVIHPTANSNYLFTNEQVIAMIEVLANPNTLGMSSDIEKLDLANSEFIKIVYISKPLSVSAPAQAQSLLSFPFCLKINRIHYRDLFSSITALFNLILAYVEGQ